MSHAKQLHHRRYLQDSLERITREGLPGNGKNDVGRTVQDTVIATVPHVLEAALAEELHASLGWERDEPVPWGRPPEAPRRGRYQRAWLTPSGSLADVHVPKLRRGNGALTWQSLTRDARCWGPLRDHQVRSYGVGPRRRALPETLALTLGAVLSLAACNRLVSCVAEHRAGCKTPALARPPPLLLVDGLWGQSASPTGEDCPAAQGWRRAGKRTQQRVVLRALGVWPAGHGDIGPGQGAEGERADPWQACFGELSRKGSPEASTALGGSDGAHGVERARDHPRYGVAHQRGIFHKLKPLADHGVCGELHVEPRGADAPATRQAKRQRHKARWAEASRVYEGAGAADIRERAARCQDTWTGRAPEAVAHFFVACDQTLSYGAIDVPESLASLSRTPNLLERFHKERRRQHRDIGMLQSAQGCEALGYVLARRETAKQRAMLQSRL